MISHPSPQNPASKPLSLLVTILTSLTIFLLPSNLFKKFPTDFAYLNGHLIDYLLPKFYLFDIPLLGLIIIYLLNKRCYKGFIILFINICLGYLFPFLYPYLVIIKWFVFAKAIIHFKSLSPATISKILLSSVLIQSIIGILQFIRQSNLFEYYILGESNLDANQILHESWFGRLFIPAYGSTPHPNILATLLGFTLVYIFTNKPSFFTNSLSRLLTYLLLTGCLLLTFSLNNYLAITIAFVYYFLSQKHLITLNHLLIIQIATIITLSLSPLIIAWLPHALNTSLPPSFSVRYELLIANLHTFISHPIFGTGLGQSLKSLPNVTFAGQTSLFLQPVHNLYLLYLVETGLFGLVFLFLSLNKYRLSLTRYLASVPANPSISIFLPLFYLLTVGALDHLGLTSQVGLGLLTLSLLLPLL